MLRYLTRRREARRLHLQASLRAWLRVKQVYMDESVNYRSA